MTEAEGPFVSSSFFFSAIDSGLFISPDRLHDEKPRSEMVPVASSSSTKAIPPIVWERKAKGRLFVNAGSLATERVLATAMAVMNGVASFDEVKRMVRRNS